MMPSGPGVEKMANLERVMQLAYEHGYRVGLQVGEHGRVLIHLRDIHGTEKVIAVLGKSIEVAANELFTEMLRRGYVPRRDLSTAGG